MVQKKWSRVTTCRRMTCGLVSVNQKGSANMPDQMLIEPILTHPLEPQWKTTLEKKGYYAIEIDSFVAVGTTGQGAAADVTRRRSSSHHLRAAAYAVQVNEVHKAIADFAKDKVLDNATLNRRLKAAELVFSLSDFKVGNVADADIGGTKYADLVTKPSDDSLDIAHGYSTFTTDSPADGSVVPQQTQSVIATVQWHGSQTINEDWEQPWAKMFPMIENSSWFTRYAAFKVKVSFQGRSREYRALFLFGQEAKTGAEYIVPIDTVAGLTGTLSLLFNK